MSHPINDRWLEMSVEDFKDWLKTHREKDEIADRVYIGLTYLENKWKQERFDSYHDS